MNKPWEIKKSDKRSADTVPTYIIFCEDRVSEPVYLKYFETSKIKINFAREQKSMMANVLSAITQCKTDGLFEFVDGKDCLTAKGTQVWCVFDRDKEDTPFKIARGNTDFDQSILTANESGINVAWSNDAFELWILLHFEDIDIEESENQHRNKYYERLTEIFKNIENPNDDLVKVKKHRDWNYKRSLKSENNFRSIVRNEIVNRTGDAIERAEILEKHFDSGTIQNHEKSPCTLMHHLVKELIEKGGKQM
ncbi:MAG: RloB domain-containing protein [Chlorobi bacterium]|nr:RloB domain-containing protein [Chlorobiota bacterium]